MGNDNEWDNYVDLTYAREGQDVRYALNDEKLRGLGWSTTKNFDTEIDNIVQYYTNNFKW